jgi:hypothetical protein
MIAMGLLMLSGVVIARRRAGDHWKLVRRAGGENDKRQLGGLPTGD